MRSLPRRNAVAIGDRLSAKRPDLLSDLLGHRTLGAALAGKADAEVIHDDRRARAREVESDPAADAAPRARDDRHLTLHDAHDASFNSSSGVRAPSRR